MRTPFCLVLANIFVGFQESPLFEKMTQALFLLTLY